MVLPCHPLRILRNYIRIENGVYPRNPFANSNFLETSDKMINNEAVNRFITGVNLDAYCCAQKDHLQDLLQVEDLIFII